MRKIKLVVIFIISCFQIAYSAETNRKKFTAKDVINWKIPGSIAVSPKGDKIAFVVTKPEFEKSIYERNIWIVNVKSGMVKQFTYGSKNEFSPGFSPDGRYISFIAERGESNDKDIKNQVWMIPISGGEARKLTSAEERVINYKWSPEGKNIFYVTKETVLKGTKSRKEKNKKIKDDAYIVDKENYRKEIWSIDITTKKAERIFKGDYGLSDMEISPDGKKIVYSTNYTGKPDDGSKFDLWILTIKDGEAVQLTKRTGGERFPRWSPDGKRIVFIANEYPEISYSQSDIFTVPSTGGDIQNITEDFDRGVSNIQWSKNNEYIFCSAVEGFNTSVYKIDVKSRKTEPIIKGDLNIKEFKLSRSDEDLVYILEDAKNLPDIFSANSDGGSPRRLTYLNPEINQFDIAEQDIIRYKSKDGLQIEGLLVKPNNFKKDIKHPLIVSIHGGPHGRVINTLLSSMEFQFFASAGYVVFAPNFRGSAGYNSSFDIANKGDIGGMDYEDIMNGVDYLINTGIADPQMMGVTGGSYGGYMTDWIISQTDRFKAAVSKYGIFNLITDFSNSNNPSWEKDYLGYYYWENLDIYLKRSAFNYADNITTPVLIIHGNEDKITFISNSKEMYTALSYMGKTVEFVRYPREGHGIKEPNHRIDLMNRCLNWFNKYVKGEPEAKNINDIVTSGDFALKVTGISKAEQKADEENITIEIKLNFISDKSDKIDIDIESEIYIVSEDGKEIPPKSMKVKIEDNDIFISAGKITLSRISDKSKFIPLTLRFEIEKDIKIEKLKVKDFPFIFIRQ